MNRLRHGAALAVLLLATVAGAQAPPADRGAAFVIGPGDLLQIVVWKDEGLTRTVPVRPDGMISLPLLNDVRAAGLTPLELRVDLAKRLREFMPAPEVAVIVQEVNSFSVAVLGEVRNPGRYTLAGQATVLDVLALAGGLTEFASPSRIGLLRQVDGAPQRIEIDYRRIVAAAGGERAPLVRPGDTIVVP